MAMTMGHLKRAMVSQADRSVGTRTSLRVPFGVLAQTLEFVLRSHIPVPIPSNLPESLPAARLRPSQEEQRQPPNPLGHLSRGLYSEHRSPSQDLRSET